MESSEATPRQRFEVEPNAGTHFAWLRTRLSVERTLMAWVRTGSAMIGFGFTIVQFFYGVAEAPDVRPALVPSAPLILGLALAGAGTVGLAIAIWEYLAMTRYLWSGDLSSVAGVEGMPHRSPALAVAVLLVLVGTFACATIAFRLG